MPWNQINQVPNYEKEANTMFKENKSSTELIISMNMKKKIEKKSRNNWSSKKSTQYNQTSKLTNRRYIPPLSSQIDHSKPDWNEWLLRFSVKDSYDKEHSRSVQLYLSFLYQEDLQPLWALVGYPKWLLQSTRWQKHTIKIHALQ